MANSMKYKKTLLVLFDYSPHDSNRIGRNLGRYAPAIAALAGALKADGLDYKLFHQIRYYTEEELIAVIKEHYDCGVFAISFTSFKKREAYQFARLIRQVDPSIKIVGGGVHAILEVGDILAQKDMFDIICTSDGEPVLPAVAMATSNEEIAQIPNIYYLEEGEYKRTHFEKPPKDLGEYPDPDPSIFNFDDLHEYNSRLKMLPFMASRGCPFNCSFCSNRIKNDMMGTNIRFYSPEKAISLIEDALKLKDFKSVTFGDDIMVFKQGWAKDFFKLYKERINLPFKCHVRPETMDEEMIKLLADAGCIRFSYGVESGVPRVRATMNKLTTDKVYEDSFAHAKKYGIEVNNLYMVGLPDETFDDALGSIKFAAKSNILVSMSSIFTPHPHTDLYNYCVENNLIKSMEDTSYYSAKSLQLKGFSRSEIEFLQAAFRLLVLIYSFFYSRNMRFMIPVVDFTVKAGRPLYPLLNMIQKKWLVGKITTSLFKSAEEKYDWT